MASLQTVSYDLRRTVRNQEQASNRKFAHRPRPSHVSHRSNIPLLWNLVGGVTPLLGLLWPSPLNQHRDCLFPLCAQEQRLLHPLRLHSCSSPHRPGPTCILNVPIV